MNERQLAEAIRTYLHTTQGLGDGISKVIRIFVDVILSEYNVPRDSVVSHPPHVAETVKPTQPTSKQVPAPSGSNSHPKGPSVPPADDDSSDSSTSSSSSSESSSSSSSRSSSSSFSTPPSGQENTSPLSSSSSSPSSSRSSSSSSSSSSLSTSSSSDSSSSEESNSSSRAPAPPPPQKPPHSKGERRPNQMQASKETKEPPRKEQVQPKGREGGKPGLGLHDRYQDLRASKGSDYRSAKEKRKRGSFNGGQSIDTNAVYSKRL